MSKNNQVLSAILLAQLALVAVVFWPSSADAGVPLLFADRDEMEIVKLEIIDSDDNKLVLSASEDKWVLPDSGNFEADGEKIIPLLNSIRALRTNRLVTKTADSHARLEVSDDKFKRRLLITWDDGEHHTLYLGSSGGAGATHFRQNGEDEVYITADLTSWGTAAHASSYIDTQYISVSRDTVTALKLENSNGIFEFVRDGGVWRYINLGDYEQFKESDLDTLVTQTTSLRMTKPLGTEDKTSYELETPQAVVTLQTESDEAQHQHVLRVGAKIGENYVVSYTGSPYRVTIAPYTATSLINKTHEDFLQEPLEEQPETTG